MRAPKIANVLVGALVTLALVSVSIWFAACGDATSSAPAERLLTLTSFSYGATGTILPDGTTAPADSVTLADTASRAGHAAWRFDLARERIVGDPSLVGFTRWAFEIHPTMVARAHVLMREAFGRDVFASPASEPSHTIYWLFVNLLFGIFPDCQNALEPVTCTPQDWQGAYRLYPAGAALDDCADCVIEFAYFSGDGAQTFVPNSRFVWHASRDSVWLNFTQRFGARQEFVEWLRMTWTRQ